MTRAEQNARDCWNEEAKEFDKALSKDEFYNAIKDNQYWDMDYVNGDVTRMGLYFFVHLNADGDLVSSVQDAEYSDSVLISDDDNFCEAYFNKPVSDAKELIIDELYPVYLDLFKGTY